MKKFLFILIAVLSAASASAQFKLTSRGFVNATDPSKNYIVLPAPEMSQNELFNLVIGYLEEKFNHGCCRIDNVGDGVLRFSMACNTRNEHTVASQYKPAIGGNFNSADKRAFVQNFSMTFRFKDEKIRVDNPELYGFVLLIGKKYYYGSIYNPTMQKNRNLFRSDGAPYKKQADVIAGLENYFNSIVSNILSNSEDNDW